MFALANQSQFDLTIFGHRHDFKVLAFSGQETLNAPYAITVELVSEQANLDLQSLLHQLAFLSFTPESTWFPAKGVHGQIYSIGQRAPVGRLSRYTLVLVPHLTYLAHSYNQRIFQNKTVPNIIRQVLDGHSIITGAHAYFELDHRLYPAREYCVQYGESDLHFVQRLCEEEGIHFHFRHSRDDHTLIFGDDNAVFRVLDRPTPYVDGQGMVADEPTLQDFTVRLAARTTQVARRDYNFEKPHVTLGYGAKLDHGQKTTGYPDLEDYQYPGGFDNAKRGNFLANRNLERHRSDYQLAEGQSNQPTLRSGHQLELSQHPRADWNDRWLLVHVQHEGKQPQVLEELSGSPPPSADGFEQGYRNSFTAIPAKTPYRPPLEHFKQAIHGSQTAKVTGPAGQEIHCDAHGRIKVQFHWDRAAKNTDKSSCWLRVASAWAGQQYGAVTIPRVGTEVLVTFQEGDPDRPLVTGCLHHVEQPVPYALPEHKTRSVLRSRSTPHTPGAGGFNELSIEDRAGQEKIFIQAERDLEQQIKKDYRLTIGDERQVTVKGNSGTLVEGHDSLKVDESLHFLVGQELVAQAGEQIHLQAGTDLIIDAGARITLKSGGHHIVISAEGIFSSTAIQLGGAPMTGAAANPLLPVAVGALVSNLLPSPISALAPVEALLDEELEEEEEEVELEDETQVRITLRIGMFFDGTGNNKANSETVSACFAPDVTLDEAAEDIRAHCAAFGYDGNGSSSDNSYGNDVSNIVRLYELYADQSDETLREDSQEASLRVYVEGIGTSSGGEDSLYSQATGRGETGIAARVEQSPAKIMDQIRRLRNRNPELIIERIEFDIFGFSRGAAAARHFANEVLKGERSILAGVLPTGSEVLASSFAWRPKTDVSINFIGLFDTVAAIANPWLFDWTGANSRNPGVNLGLPDGCANKIVHLVARDEIRENFALNSAGSVDLVLPGVHSDLGGGYLPRAKEKLLLSKPMSNNLSRGVASSVSVAYRVAERELIRWVDKGVIDCSTPDFRLGVALWDRYVSSNESQAYSNEGPRKLVFAAASIERSVRGELSLVYLRIMRELGVKHDVPFDIIDDNDRKLALPDELGPIYKKLQTYALGDSPTTGLTHEEEALLRRRYIHISAHWNAAKGLNSSGLKIVFINRPTKNNKRVVHPNE